MTTAEPKPPLGLVPRHIHEGNVRRGRLREVAGAMQRYINANLPIPPEWSEEYNELTKAKPDESHR